jgi:hypothetical protein
MVFYFYQKCFYLLIEIFHYLTGLNTGTFYSISTLLNPIYMWYFDVSKFQNADEDHIFFFSNRIKLLKQVDMPV